MNLTSLGRYRILGELGRGAMGTVYRAVDPLIEREVAIKALHPNLPEDVREGVRERFLREAKAAGRLAHPNIVIIYDVGEQADIAYIAMELLEGRSLQQVLREGRLPLDTIIDLATQIAEGLEHAHRASIVHRDVKPANVMVSPAGRAKLTDFGVAYVASSTMTQTGAALGSPKYMSPEQVTGQPVDPRSDVFALGVVLYEMLVGRTPFENPSDTTVFALMHRIARDPHRPVTQVDARLPAAFDRILARALAKRPADRYARAGEMAQDLRNLRSPVHRSGFTDATTQILTPPPGAGGPAAPGTGAAGGDLLGDLAAFERQLEEEEKARQRAEEEERRQYVEQVRRQEEAEARRRQDAERGAGAAPARRSAALEMLRQQGAGRPMAEDAAARRTEARRLIDRGLRAALGYLAEFAVEVNRIRPTLERPYELVFLPRAPAMSLSDAFADLRTAKVDGATLCDHVFLKYRARYAQPATADLSGTDIEHCRRFLDQSRISFQLQVARKNDFGQPVRATFVLSEPIPCELFLRADYESLAISIEMVNVGRLGPGRCRLAPEQLTDSLVDDLGRYMLGTKSEFARLVGK